MMQDYFANLLREKSASTIVFVKDNAACCREKPEDPTDPDECNSSDDENWQRPSSYKNSPEVNSAPSLPARKESNDSLSLLSTLSEEESSYRKHQRSIVNKFRDLKPSFKKRNRRQSSASSSSLASQEDHAALETKDDICLALKRPPQTSTSSSERHRNSWDGTDLSPMASLGDWKDDTSPSLPLRKDSNDNLIEQESVAGISAGNTPYYQRIRSSLDSAPGFPSLKAQGRPQRRASLDTSITTKGVPSRHRCQRRGSLDTTLLSPSRVEAAKKALKAPRRLSLDNSILMADEQTRKHFQRRASIDNSLSSPNFKIDSQGACSLAKDRPPSMPTGCPSRRGSIDNALLSSHHPTQSNRRFQRQNSVENAMVSSSNLQLRAKRRSSIDTTTVGGIQSYVEQTHNAPLPRRSSLSTFVPPSNTVGSPNNLAPFRAKRRSSMDNSGIQSYLLDQQPSTFCPRRTSSLSTCMPSNKKPEAPPDPPGRDGNSDLLLEAPAMASLVPPPPPPPPPQRQESFKKRIMSKLSSPKWQSKMPSFSSDVFKVSSSDDDDDESDDEYNAVNYVPGCRMISDDQLSILSDDTLSC